MRSRRCARWHRQRKELGLHFRIEIDGGVALENVADVVRAGCDWIVTGSSIFHTPIRRPLSRRCSERAAKRCWCVSSVGSEVE